MTDKIPLLEGTTPGPWGFDAQGDIIDSKGRLISISVGENYGQYRDAEDNGVAEFEANARLIAAAPSLARKAASADRLAALLAKLEQACDDLSGTRSQETYLHMIDKDGAADALLALDHARRDARQALTEWSQL